MVNGDGTKYYLNSMESKDYYPIIKLPDGLSCDQCTLQVPIYSCIFAFVFISSLYSVIFCFTSNIVPIIISYYTTLIYNYLPI